jgi:hypothetical protein
MSRRFTALRVIGTLFKVLAWIDLILGLLVAILVLVLGLAVRLPLDIVDLERSGALVGVAAFVLILIVAVLLFLFLYAAGEFLYVFLSIEENTRRIAYYTQEQYRSQEPAYPAAPVAGAVLEYPQQIED